MIQLLLKNAHRCKKYEFFKVLFSESCRDIRLFFGLKKPKNYSEYMFEYFIS